MHSRNRIALVAMAAIGIALLITGWSCRIAVAQEAQQANRGEGIAETKTRFSGTLTAAAAKRANVPWQVELKEWHLAGRERDIPIPEQEFYVAHLVWGDVVTQIGGSSQVRHAGDFWSVAKGAKMSVRIKTPGEEAYLQTFSVKPGR